ncbi:MAG: hypothetical protein Q7S09_02275 [bacterium]|nr:hypothetical protein [bacterium]
MISEGRESRAEFAEPLQQYADTGIAQALDMIEKQFERFPEEKDNLPFHNTAHTRSVVTRVETILRSMRKIEPFAVRERDITLGRFAGGRHDTRQKWAEESTVEGDFTKRMRKRSRIENEQASADDAVSYMEEVNQKKTGYEVFSQEDMSIVREAIMGTVPDFDPKKGVFQPNLNETSSIVTRALALADLGTAGMDGPEAFSAEGDALFREENLDILDAAHDPGALTDAQKEYFRKRMIGWSKFQPAFASGRKALFEKEVSGLSAGCKEALTSLFNRFDESIEATKKRGEVRSTMLFEELLKDMGYGR